MNLYDRLITETTEQRDYLLASPIIQKCFAADITNDDYIAFLSQAFHHVKHTVPLLMAVGTRLNDKQEWIREAVAEYIEEEIGHQEWILNDIEACGGNKEQVRHSQPAFETEMMVAYAYDLVNRVNPLGFFGMVHVLEGTSVAVADNAADAIQNALGLPKNAFSYLRSHGSIDIEHVKFFEDLMNKIEDKDTQDLIVNSAKKFFRLYADIFRNLGKSLILKDAA